MPRPKSARFETVAAPLMRQRNKTFAQRLKAALADKEKTPSDIAADMWGRKVDREGYSVAKGRDRMSLWLSGKAFPSRENLQKLAGKLDMRVDDLMGEDELKAVKRAKPSLTVIQTEEYGPNRAFVQFANVVSTRRATQLMLLLAEPDLEDEETA